MAAGERSAAALAEQVARAMRHAYPHVPPAQWAQHGDAYAVSLLGVEIIAAGDGGDVLAGETAVALLEAMHTQLQSEEQESAAAKAERLREDVQRRKANAQQREAVLARVPDLSQHPMLTAGGTAQPGTEAIAVQPPPRGAEYVADTSLAGDGWSALPVAAADDACWPLQGAETEPQNADVTGATAEYTPEMHAFPSIAPADAHRAPTPPIVDPDSDSLAQQPQPILCAQGYRTPGTAAAEVPRRALFEQVMLGVSAVGAVEAVRLFCQLYMLAVPEYEVARENGVFCCSALFCGLVFETAFYPTREGAKNGAAVRILEYVDVHWAELFSTLGLAQPSKS